MGPGCPLEVESLDSEQEALVDWAVLQLQGSEGKCQRTRLGVKDFSTQVVAGALYKFTLQLEHTLSKECAIREETEECKVVVWEKNKSVLAYSFTFGASPCIVSTDRICRLPLPTVFLYDQPTGRPCTPSGPCAHVAMR